MKERYWNIINVFIAGGVFFTAVRQSSSLPEYLLYGTACLAATCIINFFRLRENGKDFWMLVLPALFLTGFFAATASISSVPARIVVAAVSVILFYLYQSNFPDKHTIFMEELFSLASGFLLLIGVLAVNFYFILDWWESSAVIFILFYLLFYQQFSKMKYSDQRGAVYAAVGSLIIFEFFWATLFWPVHFLTSAVMIFAAFYAIYIFSNLYFAGQLTRRKIRFQTVLVLALVLSSLLSSAWQP